MSWRSGSEGNVLCDKFRFVVTTHLAHEIPISHTITPISHTITPISYTISESVEMGVLL
jgi:hypothetical protein